MAAPIFALAGRRIDAADADPPRFPLAALPAVRARLRALLAEHRPAALVCSAACGADLLALAEAAALDIPRRIVLPFPRDRFRITSVTDRPGDWGPAFDRLADAAEAEAALLQIDASSDPYAAANAAIVAEARRLAAPGGSPAVAVLVWDGASRGHSDGTDGFRRLAAAAGFQEITVPTTP